MMGGLQPSPKQQTTRQPVEANATMPTRTEDSVSGKLRLAADGIRDLYNERQRQQQVRSTRGQGRYRVIHRAAVRYGVERTSKKVGVLRPGSVVEVLARKESAAGQIRLRIAKGYVSLRAASGQVSEATRRCLLLHRIHSVSFWHSYCSRLRMASCHCLLRRSWQPI